MFKLYSKGTKNMWKGGERGCHLGRINKSKGLSEPVALRKLRRPVWLINVMRLEMESNRSKVELGPGGQGRELGFYSKCNGKPKKDFK